MTLLLTLNAGSSSLKVAVFRLSKADVLRREAIAEWRGLGTSTPAFSGSIDGGNGTAAASRPAGDPPRDPQQAFLSIAHWLEREYGALNTIAATSHRIVHGGPDFTAPVAVDDDVAARLDLVKSLAPLHVPFGLGVLADVRTRWPNVLHVACFDTAFHCTQPDIATRLPLPESIHAKGYRRYGFHGLNYEHIVEELPRISGTELPKRLLVFHLGNGASATAIWQGESVATTMGFTPLDGLVMGTRTGAIDPGVLLHLMRTEGYDAARLETLLYKQSGLLALSGRTSDMKDLLAAKDNASVRAVEHFCYQAARHAGSLITAMEGLDAIVFTGGIGEHAAPVREEIIKRLGWLGVEIDERRNRSHASRLSIERARIAVWRIPANEEMMLARHALRMMPPR